MFLSFYLALAVASTDLRNRLNSTPTLALFSCGEFGLYSAPYDSATGTFGNSLRSQSPCGGSVMSLAIGNGMAWEMCLQSGGHGAQVCSLHDLYLGKCVPIHNLPCHTIRDCDGPVGFAVDGNVAFITCCNMGLFRCALDETTGQVSDCTDQRSAAQWITLTPSFAYLTGMFDSNQATVLVCPYANQTIDLAGCVRNAPVPQCHGDNEFRGLAFDGRWAFLSCTNESFLGCNFDPTTAINPFSNCTLVTTRSCPGQVTDITFANS